jgi:hypothetical protein
MVPLMLFPLLGSAVTTITSMPTVSRTRVDHQRSPATPPQR